MVLTHAGWGFGAGVDLPWEFKGAAPCRAGIVPYLSAELPYRVATAVPNSQTLNPKP